MKVSKRAAAFILASLVLSAGWLWWLCERDNNIAFLPAAGSAKWIVYPKPPDTAPHKATPLSAVFRRPFSLKAGSVAARLSVRAFKLGAVSVNGQIVKEVSLLGTDWKKARTADVARYLRAGENEISVTVSNSFGPPALWLTLECESLALGSDGDWQVSLAGAAWEKAVLASEPPAIRPGNLLFGRELVKDSLRKEWVSLLIIVLISAALLAAVQRLRIRTLDKQRMAAPLPAPSSRGGGERMAPQRRGGGAENRASLRRLLRFLQLNPTVAVLLAIMAAWVVLFCNNLPQLAPLFGFDRDGHQEYVDYILRKQALPLANEGWQMYQPPLFYLLCAVIVGACDLTASSDAGLLLLRGFSTLIVLGHLVLIFLCLRLLFPNQASRQIVGLLLAGFLPANLCLAHHVTNETLAAVFVTAALYFCLRILRSELLSARLYAGVGVCLGLAMLTKFSAVLAIPVVGGALGWMDKQKATEWRARCGRVGLMLMVMFAVCGWHYFRVWWHFGNPLIGNWDPRLPFAWWQEPGFHTSGWFWRFGEALVCPQFSSIHSFADGLYSSLWGDGLGSGSAYVTFRPQWNHDLMNLGYLLALLVTTVLAVGAIFILAGFLRHPGAEGFLMLGSVAAFALGIVFMALRVPSYAQVKAFYALPAMVPLCALVLLGWGFIERKSAALRPVLWLGVLSWAFMEYAAFWIRPGQAETHSVRGVGFGAGDGRYAEAVEEYSRALRLDPSNLVARVGLSDALNRLGRRDEARQQATLALQQHPDAAEAQIQSALILGEDGRYEEAAGPLQQGLAKAPDHPTAWRSLALCFSQLGRHAEAIAAYEQGLRVNPFYAELHQLLALSLRIQGKPREAAEQYQQVLALQPDMVEALNNLAWIRAANFNDELRNSTDAVRLAERACELAHNSDALLLGTLAAAYAEAGRFKEAIATAERARELATAAGQKEVAEKNGQLLELYRAGKPYREPEAGKR